MCSSFSTGETLVALTARHAEVLKPTLVETVVLTENPQPAARRHLLQRRRFWSPAWRRIGGAPAARLCTRPIGVFYTTRSRQRETQGRFLRRKAISSPLDPHPLRSFCVPSENSGCGPIPPADPRTGSEARSRPQVDALPA